MQINKKGALLCKNEATIIFSYLLQNTKSFISRRPEHLFHRWSEVFSRNIQTSGFWKQFFFFFKSNIPPKGSCQKKKPVFFWEISPKCGWVGWLTPKQGPNPSKPPQITPKIALFDPNFTFRSPKSHKNPGERSPKNTFFFGRLPYVRKGCLANAPLAGTGI